MTTYTQEQVTLWLSRLARGMQQHGQTVFLIEQLQPSWLESRQALLTYVLATRFIGTLLVQLGLWLLAIFFYLPFVTKPVEESTDLLHLVLVYGMAWFLILAFLDTLLFQDEIFRYANGPLRRALDLLSRNGNRYKLLPALIIGLAWPVVILGVSPIWGETQEIAELLSPVLIVFWATRQRFFFRKARTAVDDIATVEALRWSWRGLLKGLLTGTCLGLLLTMILLLFSVPLGWDNPPTCAAMLLPLVGAFGGAVAGMFQPEASAIKTFANQGILLSLRSAMLAAWRTGLASFVTGMAILVPFFGQSVSWELLLPICLGLGCGLLAGLWYGGLDVLFHHILRRLLAREGGLPLDMAAFLDFCTDELHILQRVGGGYMFLHRYLLEHFAETGEEAGGVVEASSPPSEAGLG